MTEEQLKKAQKLLDRLHSLRTYLSADQLPNDLRVQRFIDLSHVTATYNTLHRPTDDQGQELLLLVEKWKREELQVIERKLTDMGVTLPAKEEA